MSDVVIAIDIGGTGIKCALVAATGDPVVLATERHRTGADRGPSSVVETIGTVARGLVDRARAEGHRPVAIGMVAPGVVDAERGVAVWSANVGFRDVPLTSLIGDLLDLPTALDHDVRGGAAAEARLGAGRGRGRVWFMPIGTGIAAAYVHDGRTDGGAHGASGEIGHVVVRPDGPDCACGQRGCLEVVASASAVGRRFTALTGQPGSAVDVVAGVAAGDPVATEVWAETIDALADGLRIGVTLYDPDVIVVGGGLAEAGAALFDPLSSALAKKLTFQTMPEIVPAALGDEAGCLGAALLARDLVGGTA
jgi:glucokinase